MENNKADIPQNPQHVIDLNSEFYVLYNPDKSLKDSKQRADHLFQEDLVRTRFQNFLCRKNKDSIFTVLKSCWTAYALIS